MSSPSPARTPSPSSSSNHGSAKKSILKRSSFGSVDSDDTAPKTPRRSARLSAAAAKSASKLRPKRVTFAENSTEYEIFDLPLCPLIPDASDADSNSSYLTEANETCAQQLSSTAHMQVHTNVQENGSDSECMLSATTSANAREEMQDVCELYKKLRNITTFYDWQDQCLNDEHLLNGKNMILSMPTGAGKTLVAETVMLREVIARKRSCILIVPYVAIAQEKVRSLSLFEEACGIYVEEYAASKGRLPPIKRRKGKSLYVATIEKANMLINSLIEVDRLGEIGVIVVDEFHMIGENTRGAVIEQALVKFMKKGTGQIVGMSATLSNIDELAMFLHASVFSTNFRPVKLIEKVKVETSLYRINSEGKLEDDMDLDYNKISNRDPDGLIPLLRDVVPKHSVLIFCPTKQNCENVCKMVTRLMPKSIRERRKAEKLAAIEALKEEQDGKLSLLLKISIFHGVAYHHSGLTADERKIIESAFQEGVINIICCTSTLAAGVNLPARRVIIKSPMVGKEMLRKAQYLQMIGRAGRAGYDDIGEAITIVHFGYEKQKFLEMINGPLPKCNSALNEPAVFSSFLLDLISLKIAQTVEELVDVTEQTLFAIQNKNSGEKLLKETLKSLKAQDMVTIDEDGECSTSTFGDAVYSSSLSPLVAKRICNFLLDGLSRGVVLFSHFHLIYMVVPFDIYVDIEWNIFYAEYRGLPRCEQVLLSRLGLSDMQLMTCIRDRLVMKEGEGPLRLYIAFMLNRIWKQETFSDVAEQFRVSRGWLQSALQATCAQASSITRFAEKVPSLWPLKHLLPDLVQHLREFSQQELIPLLALDGVKRGRARQLYNAGFKTVGSIASADSSALVSTIEHLSKRQANVIIKSAQVLLRDQLAEKVEELEHIGIDGTEFLAKFLTTS